MDLADTEEAMLQAMRLSLTFSIAYEYKKVGVAALAFTFVIIVPRGANLRPGLLCSPWRPLSNHLLPRSVERIAGSRRGRPFVQHLLSRS
jgi:hypothetical protein